MLSYC